MIHTNPFIKFQIPLFNVTLRIRMNMTMFMENMQQKKKMCFSFVKSNTIHNNRLKRGLK